MNTTISYKGRTTIVSDVLFDPIVIKRTNPRKSNKFPSKSLYYDGRYYFFEDIKETENVFRIEQGTPFEIQIVYHSYKWYQDTCYITEEFKEFLLRFSF